MEDWEEDCPKCGETLASRPCDALGCENGVFEDEDGVNGNEYYSCEDCKGEGFQEWCRECGWDNIYKCFLSPQYEAEWKAKFNSSAE